MTRTESHIYNCGPFPVPVPAPVPTNDSFRQWLWHTAIRIHSRSSACRAIVLIFYLKSIHQLFCLPSPGAGAARLEVFLRSHLSSRLLTPILFLCFIVSVIACRIN